ncbi:carbamoyltransferase [Candidatus Albibeggiatoa sp. nov. BB20]|uniref:carbamoyltransferase family protein n=1 Tax=Candidatus Albibeggiatoa sp. nov. BB20 TaxID=3162723 RepID=UPI003365929B
MNIIGISAYYHDSAVALIRDGNIIAAAQEERFTRKKHDANFPKNALSYCLQAGEIDLQAVDYIVFYDKPLVKFERLLETYLAYAPRGFRSFLQAMPVWLKEKLYLKTVLQKELKSFADSKTIPPLLFTEHHQSHAASAYFPSPFDKAAVLCLDSVGEWATTSVWLGEGNQLTPQWEVDFPHSLGLLYSAFTYFTGFKVNSGEYKLMGLAPYGEPKYVQTILDHLIDIKPDGTFRLNMDYFNYPVGLTMTNHAFAGLFDGAERQSESAITEREMDIARSIQIVTEDIVLKLARTVQKELDVNNLCLAGGVALNCVANGKLVQEKVFDNIWIQPAAGDAGGALGAALTTWYQYLDKPRQMPQNDAMQGSYLGTKFSNGEIKAYLDSINADYTYLPDSELMPQVAEQLAQEKIIGWFQGRMEFGPRALGGRSILGDPRSENMQSVMNLKIKHRESFRPFAPSILAERVNDYFDMDCVSPYMLLVATIKQNYRIPMTAEQEQLFGIEKLHIPRSELPAITHLDYSARIQTVHQETNPRYHLLLKAFEMLTGCPVLVNTSFNVRGEPIVHTPQQAYQCFMRTEMDYLVLENYLLDKSKQPAWRQNEDWQQQFELD